MSPLNEDENREELDEELENVEEISSMMTPRTSLVDHGGRRRYSRASIKWFQEETATALDGEHGLIGRDGQLRDEYIVKRQSVNKPVTLKKLPMLCDLTTEIKIVDGWVLTHLFLCGFAKMSTKIDELNKINVFPIADGDTGANMKVSLKFPVRNLLLTPSDSVLTVASNLAADVLLNGQGNSGTILGHFFVSFAEEVKAVGKDNVSIDEFADIISAAGIKMNDAVPDPVEGTLLSVSRDTCCGLKEDGPFANLNELIQAWAKRGNSELKKTPGQLIVEGVKVLEEAGVVDSGAQGFVYLIDGMLQASRDELPEASDPVLFKTASMVSEEVDMDVDHTVTDSAHQFCTEAVVILKEGVEQQTVLDSIKELGDSVASVCAPAKEGGHMIKVHIHTNDPDKVFKKLQNFNRHEILRKEKMEDMYAQREVFHGESLKDLSEAKFTVMGMCSMVLPPIEDSEELFTLPVFMVPSSTQEPIDIRFAAPSETCNVLNMQRHKDTAVRYTSAAGNPMQIKIDIMAALKKGKPLLIFLMSKNKKVSAIGRNVMTAIGMLPPDQQEKIKVYVHGWGFYEAIFIMEAMKLAREGKTIDDAYASCDEIAQRNFCYINFASDATVRKLMAWRPSLFPKDFGVEDGQFTSFGLPVGIREGEPLTEMQRTMSLMKVQAKAKSLSELEDMEIQRIKDQLKPGQKLASLLVSCVGRVDYGYKFVAKLEAAGIAIEGKPIVYKAGFLSIAASNWGETSATFKVIE